MKHILSRICGAVFAVSLLFAAVPAPTASAAGIRVTLDDAELSFSDAQPIMRNDRTFVPFRAIFEGMGASVSWDDSSHTVTANRGDRTIKLTIGRKACVVDRAGADRSFTTDAAPFIEGGRTYVPVRFAAQALGAAVGWDNAAQTVIIVDTEKMMQTAFAGQFQTINTIVQFANSCAPVTPRSVTGSIGATFTFHTAMGDIPSTLIGSLTGTESTDAAQFTATLQTDRSSIESAIASNEGISILDENVDSLLKKLANVTVEGIISRTDGKLYLKSDFLTEAGIPKGTWAMKPLGMSAGLTAVKNADGIDFVCAMAQQQVLTLGSSAAQVRSVVASLSDQSSSPTEASAGNAVLRYAVPPFTEVSMNLSGNQALTIFHTISPNGIGSASAITMTTVQRKTGTAITYERNTSSYNAAVRIDLTPGASATAPAVRPS